MMVFQVMLQHLYALPDFDKGGLEGRAWLASTKEGNQCVLKFLHEVRKTSRSDLHKEARLWKEIWGVDAFVTQLFGQDVLVMPYVTILNEEDESEYDEQIDQAIQEMVNKNLQHCDLDWRHAGVYRSAEGVSKPVFIDLSSVKPIPESLDKEKVAKRMH